MKHLADKTAKHPELDWNTINEEIQRSYGKHRGQALAKISDLIETRGREDSFGAFIMSLGLYIVAYLVNSIENDPESKIIKLIQSNFKSALALKIKESYPPPVK